PTRRRAYVGLLLVVVGGKHAPRRLWVSVQPVGEFVAERLHDPAALPRAGAAHAVGRRARQVLDNRLDGIAARRPADGRAQVRDRFLVEIDANLLLHHFTPAPRSASSTRSRMDWPRSTAAILSALCASSGKSTVSRALPSTSSRAARSARDGAAGAPS